MFKGILSPTKGGGKTGSFASIFEGARTKKKGGGVTKPSLDRKYSTPNKNNHSFRGGNVGNCTPTKRKLISDNNIQNLISIFNTNTESKLPNEWDKSESPAKRGKWGPWGD